MPIDESNLPHYWHLLTRFGEIQIILPAALLVIVLLSRRAETKPLAVWWFGALAVAVLATTASKVAFIGWGMGIPELDFTGFSGHAMIASAVYPLLIATLTSRLPPMGQRWAVAAGFVLALLVGISRVEIGVHSVSEVVAGLLLGGAVSVIAIAKASLPRDVVGPLLAIVVGVWLLFLPLHAPQLQTHSWVTELSLRLSGNITPNTRSDMWQRLPAS
jgi:membrane-associated phospholipid phosphatase